MCGKGRPSVLSMKERLVILVGFYPTRSARFLIARGAGYGAVRAGRGGLDGVCRGCAGRCVGSESV